MFSSIENICRPLSSLQVEVWTTPEPLPFAERTDGVYKKVTVGESWGKLFDCGWFRFSGTVPEGVPADELFLRIDVNGELLIYSADGRAVRAMTNVSSVFDRTLGLPEKIFIPLTELGIESGDFEIWADAGCNDLFGEHSNGGTIHLADIVRRVPGDVAEHYDSEKKKFEAESSFENDNLPVYATGHAHLDLVWLWPQRETKRKGARTFATALANQQKYPWYIFGASQPQLYCWLEKYYPELFARVMEAYKAGKWELQGAMWVEADTHLPNGESLMRQFIYGQKYWREKFGREVKNVWLPDVFGYSGSLPAIARLNGVEYILTMKNAWNLCNKFPHNAFKWTGIDGTSILAYRLPEETYNGSAHPDAFAKCVKQDAQRQTTGASMMLFGIGDGGAGPGEAHLEMLSRVMDDPAYPPVIHGSTDEFFARIAAHADRLPTVHGELYLENHQGTFTTCEAIKKINRLYESLRQDMEFAAVVWQKELPEWYDEFEQEVLFMQFHDSIPGSSIERVYVEAAERQEYWLERIAQWYGSKSETFFFNPTSSPFKRFCKKDGKWFELAIAPFSWAEAVPWLGNILTAESDVLDNGIVRLTFAADGSVSSWQYKGRELLSAPAALAVYADKGNAWNIDYGTYEAGALPGLKLVRQGVIADGPAAYCLQEYKFGKSVIKVEFRLDSGSKVCEVNTTVDWQSAEHLLRFEIPLAVDNAEAVYGAQFGSKRFSTRNETPHEKAQHEISAQRWVAVNDSDTVVSAATDCKYGFSVKNGRMNLTLLRAAQRPGAFVAKDDNARNVNTQFNDLGIHSFIFAFMADDEGITLPADTAEWLGREPEAVPVECSAAGRWLDWQSGQFTVSALRPAWEDGGILIRIYERTGKAGVFTMPAGVSLTPVRPDGRALQEAVSATEFHPFEIKTLRITVC